jgi:hypothetical protein
MVVVGKTRKGEIACDCLAAVLYGNNVIYLKRDFVEDLGHPAVFATLVSASPYQIHKITVHGWSSATAGTLEYLPGFRFEGRKNRTDAFEIVHLRIFFGCERPSAGLGGEFVHPGQVVLGECEAEDGASHSRR